MFCLFLSEEYGLENIHSTDTLPCGGASSTPTDDGKCFIAAKWKRFDNTSVDDGKCCIVAKWKRYDFSR